jgi:ribosomal protein S18 acetylase RimI-like enzyme
MQDDRMSVQIAFRRGSPQDFDYCAKLYFADTAIRELNLEAQIGGFRARWDAKEVRIVMRDGVDIGWLQTAAAGDALFLAQLFVDAAAQRQGIGTEVMRRVIAEAAHAGQAVTLGVVKTNPALRLYERLGFKVTHEDSRKFYMRRAHDAAA